MTENEVGGRCGTIPGISVQFIEAAARANGTLSPAMSTSGAGRFDVVVQTSFPMTSKRSTSAPQDHKLPLTVIKSKTSRWRRKAVTQVPGPGRQGTFKEVDGIPLAPHGGGRAQEKNNGCFATASFYTAE